MAAKTPDLHLLPIVVALSEELRVSRAARPLCQYPLVVKYKGSGSPDDAANFVCSSGF